MIITNQLTPEDLKNISALISVAPIKGGESVTVALLLQKIQGLLQPKEEKKESKGEDKKV